jgi:putative heme-binding domain-containing protein
LVADGSTFKTHDTERVVESSDRWFRPVDIKAGPDGSIYLADWYDIRLSHVDPRDNWDRSNGRIYRLANKAGRPDPTGIPNAPFDLARMSAEELTKSLSHPNKWIRQQTLRLLYDRGDKALTSEFLKLLRQEKNVFALEALWAINACGGFDDAVARIGLRHTDEHVRSWSVRLLGDRKSVSAQVAQRLTTMAREESSPTVRSQLAASVRRFPPATAIPLIRELVARDADASDPHIPLLIWWAVEKRAVSQRTEVLEIFGSSSAWQQKVSAQFILPRLAQRYAAEGTKDGLETVAALIQSAPGVAERETLMQSLAEAYKGRTIDRVPEALRKAAALAGDSERTRMLRIRLGLASDSEIRAAVQSLNSLEKPTELIEALGLAKYESARRALLMIARSDRATDVRRHALQALQHFSNSEIATDIVASWPEIKTDAGLRATALELLSRRKSWSSDLVKAVEQGTIARTDVPFDVVERVRKHDETLNQRATKLWGRTRQTPAELQERIATVARIISGGRGDAGRGKQLFATTCGTCHKLHGEGQTIGPDLTGYERDNLDFLLPSIIDPNAGIREEYTNFEMQTTDDLLLTGYIVERSGQAVTIEDAQQGRVTVPQNRIKSLQASALSRMPEGLLDAMSEDQVRDLFAYLRSSRQVTSK